MIFHKSALAVIVATGLSGVSVSAFAHSYYNLTGVGATSSNNQGIGFGITNSINGTDGVAGYSNVATGAPIKVANGINTAYDANTNNIIAGTGTPTVYNGGLPYMWYSGMHTYDNGYTKREIYTGASNTDKTGQLFQNFLNSGFKTADGTQLYGTASNWGTNGALASQWQAYYQDTSGYTTPNTNYGPQIQNLPVSGDHPYIAVAGNSSETGLGLDYGLLHVSCGGNTATDNCSTPQNGSSLNVLETVTIKEDSTYSSINNATGGLLDVALYRGADTSLNSNRNAAANITGSAPSNIQGSDLGDAVWVGHATSIGDTLSFSFTFTQAEWNATDTYASCVAQGGSNCIHTNGMYTLVIGSHGGAANSGVVYDALFTASPVPVPGAVWLFGSALAGFGLIKRKKA